MRTTTRLVAVRAAAAVGTLAVGLAGLGLGATAVAADTANIDDSVDTSLTIHKYAKPSAADTAIGRVDGAGDKPAQKPVEGVVFTAYKIDLKLFDADVAEKNKAWNKLDAWSKANTSLAASVCDTKTLPDGLSLADSNGTAFDATDNNGKAVKSLDKGAYLICETDTTGAKVDGKAVNIVDKALPFVVTLPFADSTDGDAKSKWVYDVRAFPKNTPISKPVKTVTVLDTAHGLGVDKQVTYTVDAVVPVIANATENFKYLNIFDKFAVGTTGISIESVEVGTGQGGTFANGAAVPAEKYTRTEDSTNRFAQVDFNTADGLAYLETIGGKTIRVTFKAKVDSIKNAGAVANQAHYVVDTESIPGPPNTPPTPPTPPTVPPVTPPTTPDGDPGVPPGNDNPSNKVISNWGELKVTKKDAANSKVLKDATFQVYEADQPFAADCSTVTKKGDPLSVNGKTEFTSDDSGVVTVNGLFIDSKWTESKDEDAPEHTSRCYVLVETKAPAGYVLPTGAAAETKVKVATGKVPASTTLADITNTKSNVPQLPLTGASGQVLMMAGGAALVLLAGGTVMVARRREAQD
ncbi:SpaH/EbpB family LPXTG-anchored major pilin [Actinomyces trachealis]|uniref:SpaH/EbpB family LPXTG-anchored major pilin n=1 Tax=Actinomyces trachealis TaxID=2763540 RepID=UPI0018928ED4|nr:SpaH/EbpB family LPXTG-anchored major pilin [Actinomyces trachealis]